MSEESKKELDKLKLQYGFGNAIGVLLLYGGLAILAIVALLSVPTMELADPNHLTDPAIPYNEMDNATYTWTAEELLDKASYIVPYMFLAAGIMTGGMGVLLVIPSQKRLHKVHCTGDDKWRYCPECGLKLSRLKKE